MPNRPGNEDQSTGAETHQAGNTMDRGGQPPRTRSNRGFASMDRAKQKEIASKGGRAAHAKGTAHEFDSGEARDAGRKGGVAVSRNREHMAAIGRRGGEARGHARGVVQANSAGASKDGLQNRAPGMPSERQVAIDNQRDGVAARAATPSPDKGTVGAERRPHTPENTRSDESFGR